jgi:Methyltransferase FkbM domain
VEHVPSLHLSKWLENHVRDRIIPEVPRVIMARRIVVVGCCCCFGIGIGLQDCMDIPNRGRSLRFNQITSLGYTATKQRWCNCVRNTHRDAHGKNVCTFEIEPNPAHAPAHERNAAAYKAMGWRYHYMPFAASHEDNATLEFYHQAYDLNHEVSEWGFSSSPIRKTDMVEHVPSLHLSKWLENHVRDRIIPEVPRGGDEAIAIGPKVVMKMDIEGAEWTVLPDMITSGALCDSVDYLFGEFHNFFWNNATAWEDFYVPLRQGIHNILQSSTNCKTKFEELDDEVYLNDGMPLPEPS